MQISGAEKVMGLEGCIYLAQKWYQALPESKVSIVLLTGNR